MNRKSFKDKNGKRGEIGSVVREQYSQKEKVVALIQSRGAAGTALFFEGEFGRCSASSVIIIEKDQD